MSISMETAGIHSEHAYYVMLILTGRDWPAYRKHYMQMILIQGLYATCSCFVVLYTIRIIVLYHVKSERSVGFVPWM